MKLVQTGLYRISWWFIYLLLHRKSCYTNWKLPINHHFKGHILYGLLLTYQTKENWVKMLLQTAAKGPLSKTLNPCGKSWVALELQEAVFVCGLYECDAGNCFYKRDVRELNMSEKHHRVKFRGISGTFQICDKSLEWLLNILFFPWRWLCPHLHYSTGTIKMYRIFSTNLMRR